MKPTRLFLLCCGPLAGLLLPAPSRAQDAGASDLNSAITFHASFDQGVTAGRAAGDPQLYTIVKTGSTSTIKPGLHTDKQTLIARGAGVNGDALRFTKKNANRIFYQAAKNLNYQPRQWQGSVSFWLRLDPEDDLEPGYCDPIQITPRKWNDAAFFVDFDKEGDPRDFRLGAFADLAVWNPENKPVGEIPETKRPLLPVKSPPFSRDQWTHVAFTWSGFNRPDKNGTASLYLDGQRQGTITGWQQQFTWAQDESSRIQIGINYIGLFDELVCFNRALTDEEIAQLHKRRGK